jgi:hypothetical protein
MSSVGMSLALVHLNGFAATGNDHAMAKIQAQTEYRLKIVLIILKFP